MPQTQRQRIGKWGEETAARYLEQHGYEILARNVRTAYGEIDLIARQAGGELVFVEVKTRTNIGFGYPEEAVDSRKLAHMVSSAQAYLIDCPFHSEEHWRIDVVSVMGVPGENEADVRFEHFENISS